MERYEITTPQEKRRVGPLFDGLNDSLIKTFLQGYAGEGWCDDLAYPRCATVAVKDFVFFGGFSDSENAAEFAAYMPQGHDGLIISAGEEGWLPLVEAAHPGKTNRIKRFACARDASGFDKETLRSITREIPDGYVLLGMDEDVYEMAMAEEWSRDFCSFFADADDFVERGIGFCVLHEDALVAGASSFSIYDGGIEVQVATKDSHRRKGLARACAAALVLACLSQNRFPHWDACSEASASLAAQLGYKPLKEYEALYLAP